MGPISEEIEGQTRGGVENLLEEMTSPRSLRWGEVLTGFVVAIDQDGAWVNIGGKSEGVVPRHEMRNQDGRVQVGDEVLVYVIQPETNEGRPLLSLDRALKYRGWHLLENYLSSGEPVEAEVVDFNRGGLIVSYSGIQGFVPLSQVVGHQQGGRYNGRNWLAQRVGQQLRVKVMELNRERHRLVFSERAAFEELREKQKEQFLAELKEEEVRRGRVTGIHSFGAFVDLGEMEGLIPASELSWERDRLPQEVVRRGQKVDVLVVKVDIEGKRVVLSLRRTQPHPWDSILEKYHEGQVVTGTVTKITPYGAFARIDGAIEGLIHISEMAQQHITHPKQVVQEGQELPLKILSIDPSQRRLRLSLRQAEEEG